MLIGRHSFIRQSKLSDVAGRIDYISNPKRQEYLYATYQTEGATPEFWKNLARENQLDFKASGSAGKCIEVILSILVDTFSSRILNPTLLPSGKRNIVVF